MTEEKQEKKEKIEEYSLVEVPTGSQLAIRKPDGSLISTEFALVEILNVLHKLERVL